MATAPESGNNETENGPSSPGGQGSNSNGGTFSAFQWIVGWTILIVLLFLLAKTRIGYLLIYYGLALSVILLTITQWRWFAGVLAPFSSLKPGFAPSDQTTPSPAVGAVPGAANVWKWITGGNSESAVSHSESSSS